MTKEPEEPKPELFIDRDGVDEYGGQIEQVSPYTTKTAYPKPASVSPAV